MIVSPFAVCTILPTNFVKKNVKKNLLKKVSKYFPVQNCHKSVKIILSYAAYLVYILSVCLFLSSRVRIQM